MTDPKQIADALVQDGILESYACSDAGHYSYTLNNSLDVPVWPDEIINDWRVAGKCLEKIDTLSRPFKFAYMVKHILLDDRAPTCRAICEAYCRAKGLI